MAWERPEPKYHVGDIVTITEFTDCPFGWDDWGMDDFVDEEATITHIAWNADHRTYEYYVDVDDGDYMWCENCFVPAPDIAESEMSIESLFGGLPV